MGGDTTWNGLCLPWQPGVVPPVVSSIRVHTGEESYRLAGWALRIVGRNSWESPAKVDEWTNQDMVQTHIRGGDTSVDECGGCAGDMLRRDNSVTD